MFASSYSRNRPALVGRDRERQTLRELLDDAIAGRGSLVLVSGEAGIGKTTLVQDLEYQAHERGALVLSGGCYDLTTTPPYGPWVEAVRSYPSSDEQLPELPDQLRKGGGMDGIGSQADLFHLARDFFAQVSEKRPLVLILEDLHWSDPASLELLRYLGRTLVSSAVLLVATYRQEEIVRGHALYPLLPHIVRETHATRIQLTRLDQDAVQGLIDGSYALSEDDRDRLIDYVWHRAEGNPFFVDELVQGLVAEQVLQPSGDAGWQLGDLEAVHLPPLLLQVLDSRLDRLSPATHQALQVAAVIGYEVPLDLWQSILDVEAAELDRIVGEAVEAHVFEATGAIGLNFRHALLREALYESLVVSRRRALHRHIGERLAETSSPDPDTVAHHFQQAGDERAAEWMIQAGEQAIRLYAWQIGVARFEAALELLKASGGDLAQQGWLHYRIGRLQRIASPEQGVQELETAERLASAIGDSVLAAFSLADRGIIRCYMGDFGCGLDEALAGDQALDALAAHSVPVDGRLLSWVADSLPELTSASHGDNWPDWGINIRRGTLVLMLANAGYYTKALKLGKPYAEHVSTLTAADEILLGALEDVQQGLATSYAALGLPAEARTAFARARAAYRRVGHYRVVAASAYHELERVILPYQTTLLAERQRLRKIGEENLNRARGATGQSVAARCDPAHLPLLLLEGNWDVAEEIGHAALDHSNRRVRWEPMAAIAELARACGQADLAWLQVQAMFTEGPATEPGKCDFLLALRLQRTAIALSLDADDLGSAADWIAANQRWLEWSGAVLGRVELELLRARYHLIDRDTHTARRHADGALAYASDPEQPLGLLASHRFLGHLDTLDGQFADAEPHLDKALDLAGACAAPFERALTLLELARLRIVQRRPEHAQVLLDEVRAICEPLRAQPTLDQVAALEAAIQDTVAPDTDPFGLTNREREVLDLIVEGLTNVEIGEALYISPRTVAQHLRSVYNKLGVENRAAAVAKWIKITSD